MSRFLNNVYSAYLQLSNPNDCVDYILTHPVLLSPERWEAIEDVMFSFPLQEEKAASVAYNFLHAVYNAFAEGKQPYVLGSGPLEPIFDACDKDEISVATACGQASNPDVCLLLSSLYMSKLCRYADSLLLKDDESWKSTDKFLAILLAAVEAIPEENRIENEWFEMWSRIIVSRIEMTTMELINIPDKRKLNLVIQLGEQALKLADTPERQQRAGKLYQRLGVLHLDPWFAGKTTSYYMNQFELWQRRIYSYSFLILGAEAEDFEMPQPLEALATAKAYLEKAVEIQHELDKAFALKALAETYMWQYVLGETKNAEKTIETARKAMDLMDELQYSGTHYTVMQNIISFYGNQSEEDIPYKTNPVLEQLETEPADILIKKFDLVTLFDNINQNINLIVRHDPKRALQIWQKAETILNDNKADDLAEQHYRIGMQVMRDVFNIRGYLTKIKSKSTIEIYNEIIGNVINSGGAFTTTDYAALLDTAFISTSREEEEDGLIILENISYGAFTVPELQPFVSLCNYMTAHLWVNAAVNMIRENDIMKASERYTIAIGLFLKLGYPRIAHNILLRIEDIVRNGTLIDPDAIIGYMANVALSLEKMNDFGLSQTCQSIYKMLLQRTISEKINPVAWTVLFQLMKGYAFNATLQTGFPANVLHNQKAETIIERIEELSQNKKLVFSLKDNYFLEGDKLLISYAGADEPWQGNEPEVRLQNLKMTLDKYLYSKVIPEGNQSHDYLLLPENLQALLPANTVLISQLLGPSVDGTASFYNLMFTREEIRFISGRLQDTPSMIVEMTLGDKTLRMPVLGFMVEDARIAIQEEPETKGLTRKAKATMQSAADFFLGGDSLKMLREFREKGKDHLCIWPHGPLHFFPFHLLPVNGEPICNNWMISYIPSIGVLSKDKKNINVGTEIKHVVTSMGITFADNNPYKYLDLGILDNSVKEATLISDIFNGNLIIENAVTEEAFIAAMQSSKWLHLSTHGLLDASAPSFHCLFLHTGTNSDGIMNAYELLDYRFDNVDLLTLSACQTALGRFDYSDNMRGLPAILLQCGVKTIIGTLWDSETESSELFFLTLYTELNKGASKLKAFTAAQRKVKEEFPDYRDWGTFYFTGEFE